MGLNLAPSYNTQILLEIDFIDTVNTIHHTPVLFLQLI
jgi:hypothetical protein